MTIKDRRRERVVTVELRERDIEDLEQLTGSFGRLLGMLDPGKAPLELTHELNAIKINEAKRIQRWLAFCAECMEDA